MKNARNLRRRQKGAAMVEYALLIAGVALISAAAVSVFGHKTNDMIASTAAVLPGAHGDDNAPILSGRIIETDTVGPATPGPSGAASITIDVDTIEGNSGTARLEQNLGLTNLANLIVE